MPQSDNGIRGKPRAGVGKRDGADFRRRDGHKDKKDAAVTGGKEAAVIGSTVTICNDTGARDNSTVMAAGASMPMPAIINPLNTDKWKREREEAEREDYNFSGTKSDSIVTLESKHGVE